MPDEHPSTQLKLSGHRAVIEPDRWVPGSFSLVVDGTPQSHVNLDDPSSLFFEYVQRMGHVIDLIGDPGEPITAIHLGAGAFTIPRYIHATRPGSRQQVIEIEMDLVDFVREHLPLPKDAQIRVRNGDARETLGKLPAGLHNAADLVVVDVFSGARTPAHVTTVEFYLTLAQFLAPKGVVLVNVADGPGLAFARSQASTLKTAFGHVAVLAETQILKGRRFGNVVMVASTAPIPSEWMPKLLAGGPHPSVVISGKELDNWIAGAPMATDATAKPSPPPSRTFIQFKG